MPALDAANIALTCSSRPPTGCRWGRCCSGMSKPLHVLAPSVTARGILNMTALAAVEAQTQVPAERRG